MVLGTGKSKVCVEMIKRFVEHNYEDIHSEDGAHSDKEAYNDNKTSSRGPTIIYCAPSNKAVNVGASTYVYNIFRSTIVYLSL